tara:strand:+ start:627 stop:896 length:270 start_codon:yes stop_codon:yes gene_type:complete
MELVMVEMVEQVQQTILQARVWLMLVEVVDLESRQRAQVELVVVEVEQQDQDQVQILGHQKMVLLELLTQEVVAVAVLVEPDQQVVQES